MLSIACSFVSVPGPHLSHIGPAARYTAGYRNAASRYRQSGQEACPYSLNVIQVVAPLASAERPQHRSCCILLPCAIQVGLLGCALRTSNGRFWKPEVLIFVAAALHAHIYSLSSYDLHCNPSYTRPNSIQRVPTDRDFIGDSFQHARIYKGQGVVASYAIADSTSFRIYAWTNRHAVCGAFAFASPFLAIRMECVRAGGGPSRSLIAAQIRTPCIFRTSATLVKETSPR